MKPSPNLYRKQAVELGRDAETISRALAVALKVEANGGEPVFTLAHLARRSGVSARYLRLVVDRQIDPYLEISRSKPGGGRRRISSPEPLLMDAHRWILRNMLPACRVHPASYAYQAERSAVCCARQHRGARWLIKIDIHNFFDGISEWRVFRILQGAGYPTLLAFQVARLCTRAPLDERRTWGRGPHPIAPTGILPQGAPTSGLLANAAVYGLDVRLQHIADDHELTYTRYSDDIVFSSHGDITRRGAWSIVHQVDAALRARRLDRHQAKTRIVPPGGRKIVLGLLVDHDEVLLTARFKRRLETHIRGVERFGLREHAEFRKFDSIISMINHIDGLISYANSVDAGHADLARDRWDAALGSVGYPVELRPASAR
jgi:RNA-directed DNA polymerase